MLTAVPAVPPTCELALSDADAIAELVRAINDCWLGGRYDDLRRYFHPGIKLAMPGFEQSVAGRDAIIDSYRDFGERATVRRFEARPSHVDVIGPTAVSATRFEIDYEIEGNSFSESGTDVLVFQHGDDGWRVVWRTVVVSWTR